MLLLVENSVIYLGGVKDGVEAHAIKEFMEQKGVYPTFVRMMKSR